MSMNVITFRGGCTRIKNIENLPQNREFIDFRCNIKWPLETAFSRRGIKPVLHLHLKIN